MLALAVEGYYDMEPEALYTWAGRALDAKNLAPVGLRAEALALRANGAVLVGRGAEAVALLDEAEALVDGVSRITSSSRISMRWRMSEPRSSTFRASQPLWNTSSGR